MTFGTADSAAIAAIEDINLPLSPAMSSSPAAFLKRSSGFAFTAPRTLNRRDDSDPDPKTSESIGTYHAHAGEFEPTDEFFSPGDRLKATLGKEYLYLGTPRGRVMKFTPVDLLSLFERAMNPTGLVETLRLARTMQPRSAERSWGSGR